MWISSNERTDGRPSCGDVALVVREFGIRLDCGQDLARNPFYRVSSLSCVVQLSSFD
jgi:hypothetical protein